MTIDTGSICPICSGMDYVTHNVPVGHPDFGKAFPCTCQADKIAARRANLLRKVSNLSAYEHLRFDNFNVEIQSLTAEQQNSLRSGAEMAYRFAEKPDGWILFQGGYGCGKTHLAAAIGNYVLSLGHEVIFVTVPDLLDHLRGTYSASSETTYDELFERIRNTQVLILDDLGTESPTAWAGEKLYQLFNHRYTHFLPTVISTNNELEELDGRIYSRLVDYKCTRLVKMTNLPDYRRSDTEQKDNLSNLGLYGEMTFETFNLRKNTLSSQQSDKLHRVTDEARDFAARPNGWLVISGGHGCGKTHLAAAIANHRKWAGQPVYMMTVADLLDYLKAAFDPSSRQPLDKRFQEIRTAPVLILDDLNFRTASSWAKEKLFQLIDYRYLAQLPTVITIFTEDLKNIDDRFESRFKDPRICKVMTITAPDYHGGAGGKRSQ